MKEVKVENISLSNESNFILIAGLNVLEDKGIVKEVVEELKKVTKELDIPFIFKASYDKANRSSIDSYRGPGLDKGLEMLAKIKSEYAVPLISDVHSAVEVSKAKEVLDILQIPAFLCRQTNFILNVAKQNKPMNIKKGQFLSPWEMQNVVDKARSVDNKNVLVCERGYTFGYNNLVADMRSLIILRETGCPVIFDSTHSLQLPGGQGSSSGGQKEYIPSLARAAVATGVAGIFMETHPDPENALSDGPNSLPLNQLASLLHVLKEIDTIVKQHN